MARKPLSPPVKTTEVRNTPVPRSTQQSQPQRREVSREQIAKRAYEIWKSGKGGSEFDNWIRAERELRGQ